MVVCLLSWLRLLRFVPTVCSFAQQPGFVFCRRVLHELHIEFEHEAVSLHSLQLSWKLAATCTRNRLSEADIARERKLLQLRVIYLCDRFKISQDRIWNLDETAVRIVPTGERGWTKRAEAAHVFASRAFVTVTLAANMRGGMWTQIVYEGKSDRVHPHGPAFPCQLVSHSPTHWITQEALLNMIDATDADMHARVGDAELIPWFQVLDCATQHVAKNFRSIMRDTRSHIKLCYVQRNFTAYTQPLDRAYMRAAEAKRLLETGELYPRGTAEEPPRDGATGRRPRSNGEDTPTGVEESATPAAPAVAAAPERAALSLLETLQAIRIRYGSTPPS